MKKLDKIKKGIYFKFYAADFKHLECIIKITGKCKTETIRYLLMKEYTKLVKLNIPKKCK